MAEIDYPPEYLDMAEQYKKQFGQTFDGFIYNTEAGIEIMTECIKTGKAYDLAKDPNYDPEADY